MPRNTHTFGQDERFDGQLNDEEIVIREVREHTVVWDYVVDGEILGRNTTEKERARTMLRTGVWREPTPKGNT